MGNSAENLPDDRAWSRSIAGYREPRRWRSIFELGVTLVSFVARWARTSIALHHGIWWGLVLTVPAAAFLVRLFMIQHDCGHGAFFAHRRSDDWLGRALGLLTLTPYDHWRRTHAEHHATAGNLDRRGIGDIDTLTVAEYRARSPWGRFRYRLYRHPAVMFGIGPLWIFLLQQRLPIGMMRSGTMPWLSTMATNFGILTLAIGLVWFVGWGAFLLVQAPIVLMAGAAGVWLFYVQHQFEDTHWSQTPDWQFRRAALHGSSYYDLPPVLRWLTANIGIHHVHHLSSRVPFYRLPEVLRDYPELKGIGRITIAESFRCVRPGLWDEHRHEIGFVPGCGDRQLGRRRACLRRRFRACGNENPGRWGRG